MLLPCNPPPHETLASASAKRRVRVVTTRCPDRERFLRSSKRPAVGKLNHSAGTNLDGGMAAVVVVVTVMTESPLPALIWGGLKLHVVSAGNPEQENVTLLGKLPVLGETSSV